MQSPAVVRNGTVLVIIIGLVAALALIATLFLSEVMGSRSSSREYRKRSLSRAAAVAGREHALAVLAQQYVAERGSLNASTEASPYRHAFLPDAAFSGEVPAVPGTPLKNTSHIFAEVAGWGSWKGTDDDGALTPVYNLEGVWHPSVWGMKGYSRFIDMGLYDENLQPVADSAKAFYRSRYDVLIVNLDPLPTIRQDLGADEYRPLAQRSVFTAQDSVMFNTLDSALGSGDEELQLRRDMAWQYAQMHGRGLVSMITSTPAHSYDGFAGRKLWSQVAAVDGILKPAPGATYWAVGEEGGSSFSDLAHLRSMKELRYCRDFSPNDYWQRTQMDFGTDSVRHMADMFHGVGFGRYSNEYKQLYHESSRLVTFSHGDRTADGAHPLHQKYNGLAFYATAGERPFSHKMAWTHFVGSTRSYEKTEAEQYTPFGSGIVSNDPAVDTGTMDVGGVPWEINPLTAGRRVTERMVVGLSPQLLAGSWAGGGGSAAAGTETGSSRYYVNEAGHDVQVRGYNLGSVFYQGNHSFELLWDPPMPDGSEHSFRTGIANSVGSDASVRDHAFAGFHPFYSPFVVASNAYSPETTQEQPEQLYRYLDGDYDATGSASADRRRDRFLNRLRYLRWLSWKHEFASSSPVIERRLAELDTPITYEEGLRYYRRPNAQDLNVDIGPLSMRRPFDSTAESMGVQVIPGGNPGGPEPVSISPLPVNDGAAKRYRIFPHTYPGPLWTGREGRSESGSGWSNPVNASNTLGNGSSETLWSRIPEGSAERQVIEKAFQMRIRPEVGNGGPREWATDSFFWDVAIANFYALAEAKDTAANQYRSGGVSLTIQDIDRRAMQILGAIRPGGGYGFNDNLIVTHLYNPVEPIDVPKEGETVGDGIYHPIPGGDVIAGVDIDGDGQYDDIDGDGVVDTDLPAVRDPEYIYGQYNRYWPVENPLIPHPQLDPALGPQPMPSLLEAMNGRATSGAMGTWKLGAQWDELQTFSGKDFYYHHPRTLLMASMLLNDVRQSLYGAGEPEQVETFATRAAADLAGISQLDTSGAGTKEVFVAGRAPNPSTGQPQPFSRTGRFVIKPDRLFRIMVRSQLVNLTLPADDYTEDLTETLLDAVFVVDPDEDGTADDGTLLYQRFLSTSRLVKDL